MSATCRRHTNVRSACGISEPHRAVLRSSSASEWLAKNMGFLAASLTKLCRQHASPSTLALLAPSSAAARHLNETQSCLLWPSQCLVEQSECGTAAIKGQRQASIASHIIIAVPPVHALS
jgi:hypothetical protein